MHHIRRKLLATFLLFGPFLLLAPAASLAQEYDPADTLIFSFSSNVGPLNPHLYAPNQKYAQYMVYEGLVAQDSKGMIVPSLAESWEISPDGRTYVFRIRENATFSDGTPVDAKAIEDNFNMVMNNRDRHKWMELVGKMVSWKATGPHEFTIVLDSPYYPILEDLAFVRPFRFMSPKAFPDKGLTADGIKAPIGSGPWKLVGSELGVYDLFEVNDLYWGEKPNYSKVLVKIIVDPVARGMAFETGEIDLIYGTDQINFESFLRFKKQAGVTAKTSVPMGTYSITMNTGRSPTDELAVRQAMELLIDRKQLAQGATYGVLEPTGVFLSVNQPYCNVGLVPYPYDAVKAASLLEEAGWKLPPGGKIRERDGKPLSIDYYFVGSRANEKAAAEILQSQAAALGVNLNLFGEEENSWAARMLNGEYGMLSYPTYGPPNEPHSFMSIMRISNHTEYPAQIGLPMKPEIDQAITDALSSVDVTKRQEYYKKALTIIHEQCVYVPLFNNALLSVYRDDRIGHMEFAFDFNSVPFASFRLKK